MKIKNISEKILFIEGKTIMPDETVEFREDVCELPGLKALEVHKLVEITKGRKAKKEAEPDEEIDDTPVKEEPVKKTRKRKAKGSETE